MILTLSWK